MMNHQQHEDARNASGLSPPETEVAAPTGEPRTNTIAWHYTTGHNFIRIVESGCLLPATAYVSGRERPAVWFTLNQFWEPTANKGWAEPDGTLRTLSREETCEKGAGLVRFGVALERAPYDWHEFKKRSRMHPRAALGLAHAARKAGSDPNDWRVSFEPVLRDEWVAVDVWDSEKNCWARVLHREERRSIFLSAQGATP